MRDLKKYNFLVIGLGSMGRRRIRNLLYNGIKKENIFGFNPTPNRCKEIAEKFKKVMRRKLSKSSWIV